MRKKRERASEKLDASSEPRGKSETVWRIISHATNGEGREFTTNPVGTPREREDAMLKAAIVFFVIAIIAAVLGFGGLADTSAWMAKIAFIVFIVLAIVSLVMGRRAA